MLLIKLATRLSTLHIEAYLILIKTFIRKEAVSINLIAH
jgi:hypothetical protein